MLHRSKLFLSTSLLCCSLVPAWVGGQDNSIPSAQKVIEAYVNALGGEMKLQKVGAVSVTAKSDSLFGSPSSFHVLWKNGKFLVKETEVRGAKGKAYVQQFGFDGEHEWVHLAGAPPKRRQNNASRSINNLERFGVTPYALELLSFAGEVTQNGKQEINGQATWHLIFEWPNGQKDHRYFDIESGLLACVKIGIPPNADLRGGGGFGGGPPTRVFQWHDRQGNGMTILKESRVVLNDNPDLRTQNESTTFDSAIDDGLFEIPSDVRETEDCK